MRISRKAFAFVLGVVLAFAVTEQAAKADIIYTYTGNDFTNVEGNDWTQLPISSRAGSPLPALCPDNYRAE